MPAPFDPSDEETWHGGFYEAAIVLGAVRDSDADVRLQQALSVVWRAPSMQAWSMDRWRWDWSTPLALAEEALTAESHIYGVIDVPSVGRPPVVTLTVREEEGDDWLYVGVPLGASRPARATRSAIRMKRVPRRRGANRWSAHWRRLSSKCVSTSLSKGPRSALRLQAS